MLSPLHLPLLPASSCILSLNAIRAQGDNRHGLRSVSAMPLQEMEEHPGSRLCPRCRGGDEAVLEPPWEEGHPRNGCTPMALAVQSIKSSPPCTWRQLPSTSGLPW